jgi:uncharacterized protein (TIGR00369 family)
MEQKTHCRTNREMVGEAIEIGPGTAKARLKAKPEMAVDEKGLVHGGFTFGLADFAAMLAVNHSFVVLVKAEVRFISPVKVGEELIALTKVVSGDEKLKTVEVEVKEGERLVLEGSFECAILDKHILG